MITPTGCDILEKRQISDCSSTLNPRRPLYEDAELPLQIETGVFVKVAP